MWEQSMAEEPAERRRRRGSDKNGEVQSPRSILRTRVKWPIATGTIVLVIGCAGSFKTNPPGGFSPFGLVAGSIFWAGPFFLYGIWPNRITRALAKIGRA